MAHHGREYEKGAFEKLFGERKQEALKETLEVYKKEMANNVWPNGMMREDDEGVLPVAAGVENNRVMMRFAEPSAWIGFTPEQAIGIAQMLIKHARRAGLRQEVTLEL